MRHGGAARSSRASGSRPSVPRPSSTSARGADGKTLFTSDRSQCPGASAHEPSGNIQRSRRAPRRGGAVVRPPGARARPTTRSRRRRGARDAAVRNRRCARPRPSSRRSDEVAGWCNRGHEVWAEDQDGLRHGVDCEDVIDQESRGAPEQKRLKDYLAEGLEEECRRAGCLPGWLR